MGEVQSGVIPASWDRALAAVADSPGVVLVLGAPDSGKTTWVAAAASRLCRPGEAPVAVVDADIGQASLGPPATVALGLFTEKPAEPFAPDTHPSLALSFVGSVSPPGHLLQLLASTVRLVTRAKQCGVRTVLVDTTGLVTPGIGFQLKLRKIELLDPTHLVVLQRGAELEPLLAVAGQREGLRLHRLEVSGAARRRTPAERSAYRARRFSAYFAQATTLPLPAAGVRILPPPTGPDGLRLTAGSDLLSVEALRTDPLAGLLIGLNDRSDETVGLGLLEGVGDDGRTILLRTPVGDASGIRIIQLGSLRLSRSGQEWPSEIRKG